MIRRNPINDPNAKPGDLVFFAGRGFGSRMIALRTCSFIQLLESQWISHVGGIIEYEGRTILAESTTSQDLPCLILQKKVRGVQTQDIKERINSYNGRVWIARLNHHQTLTPEKSQLLTTVFLELLGKPYDMVDCLLSGTNFIKKLWKGNPGHYFCSELWAYLLRQIGINVIPPSTLNHTIWPATLANYAINSTLYLPLREL